MLCGLQLFVGTIARSLMPGGWLNQPTTRPSVLSEGMAMVGWIKWPQFARDKYLLHTCKTRRV